MEDCVTVGDEELLQLMNNYEENEHNLELKQIVKSWKQEILSSNNPERRKYVVERMTNSLKFGTAGLRAEMGVGYDRMNSVTVMQTTQGVLRYLQKCFGHQHVMRSGIVIAYDARHNSSLFAVVSASVFVSENIPVYLFSETVPTPLLAFSVRHLECVAGIMITASHNPRSDNGYKLYWSNGCQINSPIDSLIEESIRENQIPWHTNYHKLASFHALRNVSHLVFDPTDGARDAYLECVCLKLAVNPIQLNKDSHRVVYTPMHGVGADLVSRIFAKAHLPEYIPVVEQISPNGDFPTVEYPNPEEGRSALQLAERTAEAHNAQVIFCNDPDADRFAVSEKSKNEWRMFNGNEIALMLARWLWIHRKHISGGIELPNSSYSMIASTVSSKALKAMAQIEGFQFHETLTGFKWIAKSAIEDEQDAQHARCVLLAYEEAIGFMCSTIVRDKDGVSAALVFAELTADVYARNLSLSDYLASCYELYGYHVSYNGYLFCRPPSGLKEIFDALRDRGFPLDGFSGARIDSVRDLTKGTDTQESDGKAVLPSSNSTQFITLRMRSVFSSEADETADVVVSLRGSGTEPKVKYYSEIRCSSESAQSNRAYEHLKDLVEAVIEYCLEPNKNQLERPLS